MSRLLLSVGLGVPLLLTLAGEILAGRRWAAYPLPEGARLRLGTVRFRHDSRLHLLAFSPDSRLLASGSWDSPIRLWDCTKGREVRRFGAGCSSLAFSPDGKALAAGIGLTIQIWDVASGRPIRELPGHPNPDENPIQPRSISALAYAPDGKVLASASHNGTIRLWDLATGRVIHHLVGGDAEGVNDVAYSPDGKSLASVADDGTVRLWDVATGREVRRIRDASENVARDRVGFAPDGRMLAVGGGVTATVWAIPSGALVRELTAYPGGIDWFCFSPDGKYLSTGSTGNGELLRTWEVASGEEKPGPSNDAVLLRAGAWSPDGRLLATGRSDGLIQLWDRRTGRELGLRPGHRESVPAVAFSPDGRTLVTSGEDNTIRLWDAAVGKEIRSRTRPPFARGSGFAFAPDGRGFAVTGTDQTILLWSLDAGQEVRCLRESAAGVDRLVYQLDGKVLAAGSDQGLIELWDTSTGKKLRSLAAHQGAVRALACAPDGRVFLSGGADGLINLWKAGTGEWAGCWFHRHEGPICAATYSPDGRLVASASTDGTLNLWEVASRGLVGTRAGHGPALCSLTFLPGGRLLAGGGEDGVVRVWDTSTGEQINAWAGHCGAVLSLSCSPEGSTLASASADTTVLLWEVRKCRARMTRGQGKLSRGECDSLWQDLRSTDALRAQQAVWRWVSAPEQAISVFRERLHPVFPPDSHRVAELLANLNSDHFTIRKQATEQLAQLGDLAISALLREGGTGSLDRRRRIEELLQEARQLRPEHLQQLRAIQVLETTRTPEAEKVLAGVGRGWPEAWLTREARVALARVGGRDRSPRQGK